MATVWKAALLVYVLLNMAEDKVISSNISTSSAPFLGKLLVIPMDGSHWVGMKAIAQEMGRRGHQVTVVIPEITIRIGPGKHYPTVTFPVPYDKAYIDTVMSANKDVMSKEMQSFIEKMRKRITQFQKIKGLLIDTAESLLFNQTLISHLQQQGFDAVLTDPMVPTGSVMARKFGIPTINLLRGIPCSLDFKSAGCPSPPSFVPRFFTGYTDKMSFKQRIINTIVALLEPLLCRLLYWRFDQLTSEFLGEDATVSEILSDSDIWLLRLDFTLELPRPLMPNMVLVGGINCKVRNPLPDDLQPWVSGEHGFVVMTFGTMVADMPEETRTIFFDAFTQIPQKVIWRYIGSVPKKVPKNVKLMKWVPQNDLLAHPGARAFITHAGSHGLFEGLCHAVPMLMMPLNAEQPENAQKLAIKGAGVVLNIQTITTEILVHGLKEVINNPKYKENLQKLSAIHNDHPVDPLELSVFWTEGCNLTDISIFTQMPSIEVLTLSVNSITSLAPLAGCLNLCELYLRRNRISSLSELSHLRLLGRLKVLWLAENPCCGTDPNNYRLTVLRCLPRLQKLDNQVVTEEEVALALTLGEEVTTPTEPVQNQISTNGHPDTETENDPLEYSMDETNKIREQLGMKPLPRDKFPSLCSPSTRENRLLTRKSHTLDAILLLLKDLDEDELLVVHTATQNRLQMFTLNSEMMKISLQTKRTEDIEN